MQAAGSEQLGRIKEKLFSRGQLEKEAEEPFFFKGYSFGKSRKLGRTGFQKQILSREQTELVSEAMPMPE